MIIPIRYLILLLAIGAVLGLLTAEFLIYGKGVV